MNNNELSAMINPSLATADACLMGSVFSGDDNARKLLSKIAGVNGSVGAEEALAASVWLRHTLTNRLFDVLRMTTFVDIGCGYAQRGYELAKREGVSYYGIDLPPVIETMTKAMRELVGLRVLDGKIHYCAADATDHRSVHSMIHTDKPLFIATDGLMMYLTENEAETVIYNINSLLTEFGGVWVTCDDDANIRERNMLYSVFNGDTEKIRSFTESGNKYIDKSAVYSNSFTTLKGDEQIEYLDKHGFNCRKINTASFIEDLDLPEAVRKAFDDSHYLALTSKGYDKRFNDITLSGVFDIDTEDDKGSITISVRGRLDTVNAPKLIEAFEENYDENSFVSVTIDMSRCSYVSSAGIRAILMIYKKVKHISNGFSLQNIRPEVLEILQVTGFTEFL